MATEKQVFEALMELLRYGNLPDDMQVNDDEYKFVKSLLKDVQERLHEFVKYSSNNRKERKENGSN